MVHDSELRSDFLRTLQERGFIYQCSALRELDDLCRTHRIVGYIGFDCTAKSLHIGSLVQIMMMYWMQQTGHVPIVLLGGATTRVGDPTGKEKTREKLNEDEIAQNLASIKQNFKPFLNFGSDVSNPAMLLNNMEWHQELTYLDFLSEVAKYFSVNRMLSFESVKQRLAREEEYSFLEFNYMLLQSYDFVQLHRRYGAILEMGGSDQWGNIISGVELGRKSGTAQLYALTSPLITKSDGTKMGKTASGAVWLDPDLLSPYEYWQFWRNTDDKDVITFLKLFTSMPLNEIQRFVGIQGKELNAAKIVLADAATQILHGEEAARKAHEAGVGLFSLNHVHETLPTALVNREDLSKGLGLLDALGPRYTGLVSSSNEARRMIAQGAIKVNDTVVVNESLYLTSQDLNEKDIIKLSLGKKKHSLLKVT